MAPQPGHPPKRARRPAPLTAILRLIVLAMLVPGCAIAAHSTQAATSLTAEDIVRKNAEARGGLDAWRAVETLVSIGHVETASDHSSRPFVLEQKRPDKTRFEISVSGRKNVRAFDGSRGWSQRPGVSGEPDIRPFNPLELSFAKQEPGIDGPLIDSAARGTVVSLEGVEQIYGQKAYRLNLRFTSGEQHRLWIDVKTFLDVRYDRTSYTPAGKPTTLTVLYLDYHVVDGLQIPFTTVIGAGSGLPTDRLLVDRVAVNAPLDDRVFTRPVAHHWRHAGGEGGGMEPRSAPVVAPAAAPTSQ